MEPQYIFVIKWLLKNNRFNIYFYFKLIKKVRMNVIEKERMNQEKKGNTILKLNFLIITLILKV